jgi:type VI secretion system secreted protein VgrG
MDNLSALLSGFASAFTQDNRLFSLHFAQSWLDSELLPHTLSGREYISEPFRFDVECLSSSCDLALKDLMGQGVDIAIHRDGDDRVLAGIVTSARQTGSDGGFARYGLTVEPAFAVLKLHRNSRVFQGKSVEEIVGLVLDEHIASNPAFARYFRHRAQLTQATPARSYCQQYRESDFAFITRLLREEGISYYFDFDGDIGLHTLALFDSGTELPVAQQGDIRFHRADATEDADSLTRWSSQRTFQSGTTQLSSFDYKRMSSWTGESEAGLDHGEAGSRLIASLEDYDAPGLYYGSDSEAMNRYATLRQQAKDLSAKQFHGGGVVRGLAAGQWFTLHDHPAHADDAIADRQFVVLSQRIEARNNLPGDFDNHPVAAPSGRSALTLTEAGYRNDFTAVRKAIPIVPSFADTDLHQSHAKPVARGTQTATVVGPAGEEIYCDSIGRIKIQFHWTRPQDHDRGKHGASAERNDFSSCWVRVLMPAAGAGFGHQFIPRIGQEVLVDFIEGDIDRPVVVRALYNGRHATPHFGDAGSMPANKTLSGIRTREHKSHRHNELIFDDTTSQLRVTFATDHGKTQLNQGYLIHPRSEGNGTPRGEGFELRTDNAGAIRAAQGLLLITEPRSGASGHQLDRTAPLAQLQAAQHLAKQLGDTAGQQHANTFDPQPPLDADPLASRKPHLLLHGHGGTAAATPRSTAIAAGKDLHLVSQRDTHLAAGRHWLHHTGESISLFVANLENKMREAFKLIAAKGNILIQAQKSDVELTADKKITITVGKENLTASAGKEFLLQSGGGYIRMSGGNVEIHCPGTLSMKAKSFVHEGGGSEGVAVPEVPRATMAWMQALTSMTEVPALASIDNPSPDKLRNVAENGANKAIRRTARKTVIAYARASAQTMPENQKAATLAAADRFERNIDAVERAKLCQNIYVKDKADDQLWPESLTLKQQGVEGFAAIGSPEGLKKYGLKPSDLSPSGSNFRAAIYEPDKAIFGDDAKPVLVFKGTENMEDWKNNLQQGLTGKSEHYQRATTIAEKLSDQNIAFEISGHSLGGGLGSAAAQVSGMDATTFNSAGLNKKTIPQDAISATANPETKINAYRLDGDILTYLQEDAFVIRRLMSPAIGKKITIPNEKHDASRLDRHGMDHVIPALEAQKTEDLNALASS